MFDNFLIRSDSLANETQGGKVVGFEMAVRHANYRGCFLSLHNGYYLCIDGERFLRSTQSFEINGKAPRSFDELTTAVWEHWDFDDEAILHVVKPGGLTAGWHEVEFQQSVLAAYGYHDTDEEWVRNPPEPGYGVGSDKTPIVVKYRLFLASPAEVV